MEAAAAASALEVLRWMYRQSKEAPEAFCAEYAATTARAMEMLAQSSDALLIGAGGETCLHYAAGCGCLEACGVLLGRLGALNFQQDSLGQTPLFWAARRGMVQTADLLLAHGADPEHADGQGLTPLHLAASLGLPRLCRTLQAYGGRGAAGGQTSPRAAAASAARHQQAPHAGPRPAVIPRRRARTLPRRAPAAAPEAAAVALLREDAALVEPRAHGLDYAGPAGRLLPAAAPGTEAALLREDALSGCLVEAGAHGLDYAGPAGRLLPAAAPGAEAAALLREDALHGCLVEAWAHRLDYAGPAARLLEEGALLDIDPPEVEHVSAESVWVSCVIADLEYRLVEYVLEVRRRDDAPRGAAPLRVYYARTGSQRKVDDVLFEVPRRRPAGAPVWEPGGVYQFRLTGRCYRREMAYLHHPSQSRLIPQQLASEWSKPAPLLPPGARRARQGRAPNKIAERVRRQRAARPALWEPQ